MEKHMLLEQDVPLYEETIIRLQQNDTTQQPDKADEGLRVDLGCPWEVASEGCCQNLGCCGQGG